MPTSQNVEDGRTELTPASQLSLDWSMYSVDHVIPNTTKYTNECQGVF